MEKHRNKQKRSNEANRTNGTRERRKKERRMIPSKGYTYISVVGWIDRRERTRRSGDTHRW